MFLYINKPLFLILLFAILFPLSGFSQNNTELKPDSANVCVLRLDYETYKFNGGNLSYYKRFDIDDSLPLISYYKSPSDFGSFTFKLKTTEDTIFHAKYNWLEGGNILFPSVFSLDAPFIFSKTKVQKPNHIQYYDAQAKKLSIGDSATGDKIWKAIDSLEIMSKFAKDNFKVFLFPYKPMAGPNEWIVFLISSENPNSINNSADIENIKIFPNPVHNYINIALPDNTNTTNIIISDINGKQLYKAAFNTRENPIQIPIKNFSKGIYLLQVNTQDKTETYKIIKQ